MKKCNNPDCSLSQQVDGGIFVDEDNFCYECGKPLAEKADEKCVKCGYILGPGKKFCPRCGDRNALEFVRESTRKLNEFSRDHMISGGRVFHRSNLIEPGDSQ